MDTFFFLNICLQYVFLQTTSEQNHFRVKNFLEMLDDFFKFALKKYNEIK